MKGVLAIVLAFVASDGFRCEGGYHACMSDCSRARDLCTGEACNKSFGDCIDSCFANHCRSTLDLTAITTEGKAQCVT